MLGETEAANQGELQCQSRWTYIYSNSMVPTTTATGGSRCRTLDQRYEARRFEGWSGCNCTLVIAPPKERDSEAIVQWCTCALQLGSMDPQTGAPLVSEGTC